MHEVLLAQRRRAHDDVRAADAATAARLNRPRSTAESEEFARVVRIDVNDGVAIRPRDQRRRRRRVKASRCRRSRRAPVRGTDRRSTCSASMLVWYDCGIDHLHLLEAGVVSNCVARLPPNAAPAACARLPEVDAERLGLVAIELTEISGASCVPLLLTLVAPRLFPTTRGLVVPPASDRRLSHRSPGNRSAARCRPRFRSTGTTTAYALRRLLRELPELPHPIFVECLRPSLSQMWI